MATFRVHLLVPAPDGPIQSEPGGSKFLIGKAGSYQVACNPELGLSDFERCTSEPWAVRCNACRATAAFKAIDRPKPGTKTLDRSEDTEGCC